MMMEMPTKQEKIEQIFSLMPKKYQQKYAEMHKKLPNDHIPPDHFFELCQNSDHASGILNYLQKEIKEKALKKSSAKTRGSSNPDC